jgi:hypothetical protein
MKRHALFFCAPLFSLMACYGAHHQLPAALPASAPVEARAAMYRSHRPQAMRSTVHIQRDTGMEVGRSVDSITLANGAEVTWPSDLLPLVGADSPIAAQVHEAERYARTGTVVGLTGLGLFFGGIGLLTGGLVAGDGPWDQEYRPMVIAGGVLTLAGLATAIGGGVFFSGRANAARRDVFLQADAAMRARLRICGEEPQLVDCDTGAAVAPMPGYAPVYAPSSAPTIPWQHGPAARRPDE